MPDSF